MRAINLIPPEQRRGAGGVAGRTGGVVYVIIATLVALVVLGVLYVSAVHQVATRKTTLAQVTAQASAVTSQVTALQPYVAFQSVSQQRIQGVAALAAGRFDWPDAMAQLALSLPHGVHLSSIAGTAAGAGTSAAAVSGGPSLAIAGCAPTQDVVAATLTRLRELRNVTGAGVSTYAKAGGGGCPVVFNMSISYATYSIPAGTLKPGAKSTVGG